MGLGEDARAVSVPGLPKSISREVTFERDVVDPQSLRRTARTLAQDVTRSLRRNRLWARTVRVKIRYAGFETHTHQATLEHATDVDQEVLRTLDRLLDEALAQSRPVRLIGVGAAPSLQRPCDPRLFGTCENGPCRAAPRAPPGLTGNRSSNAPMPYS